MQPLTFVGTYVYNASSCEDCPSGYYAPTAQVDQCLECGAGDYTEVALGATKCSSCDGGTYSEGLAVNCSVCVAGTSSSSRAASCTACEPGKYCDRASCTACENCEAGKISANNGSTGCQVRHT